MINVIAGLKAWRGSRGAHGRPALAAHAPRTVKRTLAAACPALQARNLHPRAKSPPHVDAGVYQSGYSTRPSSRSTANTCAHARTHACVGKSGARSVVTNLKDAAVGREKDGLAQRARRETHGLRQLLREMSFTRALSAWCAGRLTYVLQGNRTRDGVRVRSGDGDEVPSVCRRTA
jgi:hypothetical protein